MLAVHALPEADLPDSAIVLAPVAEDQAKPKNRKRQTALPAVTEADREALLSKHSRLRENDPAWLEFCINFARKNNSKKTEDECKTLGHSRRRKSYRGMCLLDKLHAVAPEEELWQTAVGFSLEEKLDKTPLLIGKGKGMDANGEKFPDGPGLQWAATNGRLRNGVYAPYAFANCPHKEGKAHVKDGSSFDDAAEAVRELAVFLRQGAEATEAFILQRNRESVANRAAAKKAKFEAGKAAERAILKSAIKAPIVEAADLPDNLGRRASNNVSPDDADFASDPLSSFFLGDEARDDVDDAELDADDSAVQSVAEPTTLTADEQVKQCTAEKNAKVESRKRGLECLESRKRDLEVQIEAYNEETTRQVAECDAKKRKIINDEMARLAAF